MKMYLGGTPLKSMNIRHYEMDTNDCTMKASDLQAGVTGVAKGQKITGTGKCFSFALYGAGATTDIIPIPSTINVVEIASLEYPIKAVVALNKMSSLDFTTEQTVAIATIDNQDYPIRVNNANNLLVFSCDKSINLEYFVGKDEYR